MDEDWLLYLITSLTFTMIFLMCFIRHSFTFFERQKIIKTSHPTFPFGNLYDVILQKTSMSMQLWKFYIKFKRKKCSVGGFYVFLKPAVIITSSTHVILQENKKKYFDVDSVELRSTLLNQLCVRMQTIWLKILANLACEQEQNYTKLMDEFVNSFHEEIFDLNESVVMKKNLYNWNKENIFSLVQNIFCLNYSSLNTFIGKKHVTNKLCEELIEHMKNKHLMELLTKYGFKKDLLNEFVFMLLQTIKKATTVIAFTIYELSCNKELQEDLRAELIRFTKENNLVVEYEELNKLEYLEMVICETLRKYPLEPFFYKTLNKDYFQNESKISKDLLIFLSIFGIHHDPENYTNPELFDPDRFSQENLHFVEDHNYLPHGFRSRYDIETVCIKMIMKIILLKFVPSFQFVLGKQAPKNITFDTKNFNILKLNGFLWLQMNKIE